MESSRTNLNSGRKPLPQTLFGYDVVEYLGEGAGSDIYAVSDPRTHQIYALKHVVRTDPKSERFIEQLHAELEVGRVVRHPGLRRSVEMTVNRTLLRKIIDAALVLELFDGQSLEARPTASMETTLDCFIQVGRALDALHAAGFVHCDLKPNNILRATSGEVKVIDLGQACKKGVAKARMQGTPDYMAPEQVKCAPVTARTDIFNFGATLYWALTGKNIPTLFRLKKGSNSFLLDDQIASPQTLNPGVPDALSHLVMECVRTSPSKRPESMYDVTRRLELILHHVRRASQIEPMGGDGLTPAGVIDDSSPSRIEARSYAVGG